MERRAARANRTHVDPGRRDLGVCITLTSVGDVTVLPKVLEVADPYRWPAGAADEAALLAEAGRYHSPFVGASA
jgi:hypothetical protein